MHAFRINLGIHHFALYGLHMNMVNSKLFLQPANGGKNSYVNYFNFGLSTFVYILSVFFYLIINVFNFTLFEYFITNCTNSFETRTLRPYCTFLPIFILMILVQNVMLINNHIKNWESKTTKMKLLMSNFKNFDKITMRRRASFSHHVEKYLKSQ